MAAANYPRLSDFVGRRVKRGQLIGRIGSTGLSTGPHFGTGPDPEPADDYGQGCEDDPLVEQDLPTGGDE